MKRLTSSLPAKTVAVLLSGVLGTVLWATINITLEMYEEGNFSGAAYPLPGLPDDIVFPGFYAMLAIGAAEAAALLALVIFLVCAAGHRRGAEGITKNLLDKIPLELFLGAAGTISGLLFYTGISLYGNALMQIMVCAVFLGTAQLFWLAMLLTCATRLKAGKWWRNTIVYYVLKLLRHGSRKVSAGLRVVPLVWRTGLLFCGATLLNILFAVWFFTVQGSFFPFLLGVLFNAFLLYAFCRTSLELQKLRGAGERLAAGDTEFRMETGGMYWEFKRHGENLNRIGEGMAIAVNRQMRSERLKTELITNVSHDIKTPLTSILNYVDLLGKERLEGKSTEYVQVLERQARRLQKLTEDLIEASKASTGNLNVTLARTGVCELVRQAAGEYAERLEAGGLECVVSAPEQEIFILADGRLLWRVMDNLLGNVVKYAQSGTRVYLNVTQRAGEVTVSVKNISRDRLNMDADELMERFVRGESARSSEGSGLGLNIARSLMELQKGVFMLGVDGDLFKAELRFHTILQ